MRYQDWQQRIIAAIEAASGRPFLWRCPNYVLED